MSPVLVLLNYVIEGKCDEAMIQMNAVGPDDAREALRHLELFPLAAGALNTLLKHPGDEEGEKHAKRVVEHLEESKRRAEARLTAKRAVPPPTPQPIAGDDASDLV